MLMNWLLDLDSLHGWEDIVQAEKMENEVKVDAADSQVVIVGVC